MNKSTPNNSEKPRQKFRLNARLKTSVITDVVLIFILAALFFFSTLSDQPLEDVFFSLEAPLEVTVCADTYTFSVEYLNTSGFPLTNQEVTIALPAGVKYIEGSLNDTSTLDVVEHDITDLSSPVFRLDNLADGASVGFSIDYEVSIPAMEEILNEGVLQNKVILESNEGTAESLSAPYNALYAALNIIEIDPVNQSVVSGDTTTRMVKIVNGGYGKLSSFFLTDVHGEGIELVASDLGQINATKDTIFLSGVDFTGIGNGDSFFDNNETIIITESILAFGCSGGTISSSIDAGWSCKGEIVVDATMNANISTSLKLPSLSLSTKNALSTCFGPSTANTQEITVKNNGQGIAIDVELDIWKSTGGNYSQNIFTRFDTSSLLISVNGESAEKITPRLVYTTKNTGDYACLGANPIGRVILDLPNLSPKATAVISWDTYNCCINVCRNETNTGWKTLVKYTDACETEVKTASKVGEHDLRGKMTVFTESPYHLQEGQMGEYVFTISSFRNDLPKGDGAHYEVVFDIPEGLKWNGNSSDLNFVSGTKSWTPTSIDYDSNSRSLTAKYLRPEPFKLPKAEIQLQLQADCSNLSAVSNEVDLEMNVNYIADTTCTESCSIPFFCSEVTSTKIMCPAPCNEGINMTGFQILRNSYGIADNDQNGYPDDNPQLDRSKVKKKRAMVGDTLRATFKGSIHATSNVPSFSYGYASTTIDEGDKLTSVGASVKIYDASTASYINCDQVVMNASNGSFTYDFSPAVLGASCAELSGFQFENGDSLWLYADYKVTGNIGGKVKQVDVDNSFYLSTIANPTSSADKYGCGVWGDRFTMIGYYFVNEKGSKTTISSCNKVINQDFKLSIGDCCSNYNGGNLFPYEYRQWAHVKKAQFTIPDHYEVLDIYMYHRATKYTNATINKTINNIQPDSVVGNTYYLDIEQFFDGHGGSVIKSDDGFRATLYVKLAPSCDVPENTYQDVDWKVSFQESEWLSNSETAQYTSNPDQIRFSPPSLQLSSPTPIIDGLGKNISWTLNVKSGGGGSNNSWVHVKVPNHDVTITSIVDQASGDTLEYSGDIYKLGAISSNATQKLSINARYSACQATYIDVFAGYECQAYPDNFANFKCSYTQTKLEVEPELAELQMRLQGDRYSENCVIYTDIEVELASVKQGYVGDIQVKVILPGNNSMSLVSDSTKLKYPLSGSYNYIQDPTVSNNEFTIDVNNEVAEIAYDGLVGITNTAKNRMKIAFRIKNESGYKAGDLITIVANSYEPCGKPLPSITVPFDVNMKFTRPVIAGLTDDKGNNWSGAWGDFNNDGYEDLYVAEFNHWEAGKLYINNGNGQFTLSTSSGAPIQDKGASAGASWGDYDNDGDLDLFVSNNVRAVNHLYQNNGDGTFTRQDSIGDISSYEGYCHNAAWIDYDNDGWLDIFVSDYMPTRYNQLYHNNGDGTFSRATDNPIALEAKFSMGATWADYDNDGLVDLFVPNGRDDNNSLYHNEGNGQFTKITGGDIVNDGGNSTGSSWGDYDNDGDMDLFVTNASNQNNFFYVNNGDGTFTKNYTSIITQDG
ncbi:MAG: VCBS repeat-containing protein, partial [Bacteroidota bacterium]